MQQGPVPMAERVELVLNDRGRAALAEKLGPAVDKIEGQIVSEDDGAYVMSVFHVRQLDGNSATWTGEKVSVARENTIGYQLRRLNKPRTWLLAGGVTVATVLFIFGKSLNIFGGGAQEPPIVEPPPHSR